MNMDADEYSTNIPRVTSLVYNRGYNNGKR